MHGPAEFFIQTNIYGFTCLRTKTRTDLTDLNDEKIHAINWIEAPGLNNQIKMADSFRSSGTLLLTRR